MPWRVGSLGKIGWSPSRSTSVAVDGSVVCSSGSEIKEEKI